MLNSKQRIRWSLNALTDQGIVMPFTGIPFVFLGNRTLSCHHGPDLNKTSKIKQRDIRVAKCVSCLYYSWRINYVNERFDLFWHFLLICTYCCVNEQAMILLPVAVTWMYFLLF